MNTTSPKLNMTDPRSRQTDTTAVVNSPNQLQTAQTLDGINKQVAQNVKDLPAAIAANQQSGLDLQGKAAVDGMSSLYFPPLSLSLHIHVYVSVLISIPLQHY